jgi:hypothetical protein
LTITGSLTFEGLILVNGDVRLSGGGAEIHVLGSLLVTDSLVAVDETNDVRITGTADVNYSSEALDAVTQNLLERQNYVPVYHKEA